MKKIKILSIIGLMVATLSFTGCMASWNNQKALKGGYFTTNKANYVVLNESGGEIMDCWVLKDVYVESEDNSDGLRFVDKNGDGIIIQGDSKVIRINNDDTLGKYVEYHIDTDLIPYDEFIKKHLSK